MSWAEEDWTVGLSGRVLQKVKELQVHKERLFRENKQKQLQLDNIHASLEKQIVKVHLFYARFYPKICEIKWEIECSPVKISSFKK
uniref:Centromere protein Cenp-F N-terminal domain-containing protein n=1 Tax=Oryzias melastigma TaxID=30732 RepID=A0A3B3CGY6_ORYME